MKRTRAEAIEQFAIELENMIVDYMILEAMQQVIRERQRELYEAGSQKSLYSDNERRFVENGKPYRFPAFSTKLPADDDGIYIMDRIRHQLAMPS